MKTQEPTFEVQIDEAARVVLSDDEIQQIQGAFRAGARGSLIIGLKDGKRLLPQFLPDGSSETTADKRLAECLDWLRRIGCDHCISIGFAPSRSRRKPSRVSVRMHPLHPSSR